MTTCLADLEILALDCQATGSRPGNGCLLEIGWTRFHAADHQVIPLSSITSHLLKLPEGIEIPRRISRITGIYQEDLRTSSSSDAVWSELVDVARKIAVTNQKKACPTVIHYSRFEEPFLRQLHRQHDSGSVFPFDIFCSHEIAKRLFPGLPRRGIRAIAGFFGHSVAELKRCEAHVAATVVIWRNMVNQLADRYDVCTPDQLRNWLTETCAPSRAERVYPMNSNIRSKLPNQPGVYKMLRANGDLLYIGKARLLRQRVNRYFQKSTQHPEHILEMLSQAGDLEVNLTDSAMEAAILEADQIKNYSPPYNIALRKRDRNLWFCSRDFRRFALAPDDLHRYGPLPSKEPLVSLSSIGELIDSGRIDTSKNENLTATAVIGIPEKYAPPRDVFQRGFQCFCQKHRRLLKNKPVWRALITIGVRRWRDNLAAAETVVSAENSSRNGRTRAEIDETSDARDWTPESVSDAIESVITQCAHWIRRSRWLCLLSESTLAWEANDNPEKKIIIVFHKGVMLDRQVVVTGQALPLPPGYNTKFRVRQQNLDLVTYDRLRVVTTEMRRLISEERKLELRSGLTSILRNAELSRALRWV
jgi:DNA polymerase-3 subunit epsilon